MHKFFFPFSTLGKWDGLATKECEKGKGSHTRCGLIPAAATYISSFPIGIPIPWTPRSPSPRIRLPSVRTIISTCDCWESRHQRYHNCSEETKGSSMMDKLELYKYQWNAPKGPTHNSLMIIYMVWTSTDWLTIHTKRDFDWLTKPKVFSPVYQTETLWR